MKSNFPRLAEIDPVNPKNDCSGIKQSKNKAGICNIKGAENYSENEDCLDDSQQFFLGNVRNLKNLINKHMMKS